MKYYTVKLCITSKDAEDKELKGHDTYDAALKYYHSIFNNNVGVGKKASAMILDENLNVIKTEVWVPTGEEPTEE